jgi:hypothetical protein
MSNLILSLATCSATDSVVIASLLSLNNMTNPEVQLRWLTIAMRKRELQRAALDSFAKSHPVPAGLTLRGFVVDADEASGAVADGSVSCVDLVTAYCHQ